MPDEDREKTPNIHALDDAALFGRIVDILEEARSHVARTVNSAMVVAYWLIGREIVEEEQKGQKRADYGKALLQELSRRLSKRYGGGFSVTTLQDCRKFYLTYVQRLAIQHPLGVKFTMPAIGYLAGNESKSEILSQMGRELGKDGKLYPPDGELTPKQRPTAAHPQQTQQNTAQAHHTEVAAKAHTAQVAAQLPVPIHVSQISHQQFQTRIRGEALTREFHLQIVVDTRVQIRFLSSHCTWPFVSG